MLEESAVFEEEDVSEREDGRRRQRLSLEFVA